MRRIYYLGGVLDVLSYYKGNSDTTVDCTVHHHMKPLVVLLTVLVKGD